jgi:outer membrane biosynthesis protein TonB
MPVTQIPSRDPVPQPPVSPENRDLAEAQHWESAYRGFNPDHVPHLLIQLQDDLSRARKREAAWLSVILHLLIVILLWNSEKIVGLFPHRPVVLAIQTDADREKNATYLELPPDEQKLTRRPDAKAISDKDRIATSKAPQVNREDLRKLLQSRNPGTPGEQGKPPQPQAGAPPQAAQNQSPPPPQPQQPNQESSGFAPPRQNDQIAQMQAPPQGNRPQPNFNNAISPGSAIEQAAQAAAANRGHYGGGDAGDYGLSQGRSGAKALDQAEVLTDTLGVDFGPYLTRIVQVVRQNWYNVMPPSVYPPIRKQGKLSIEFIILKDGKVSAMARDTSSGDVGLDRAAWASITTSNPFPPLPKEFLTQCGASSGHEDKCILGLRFFYFYNLEVDKDLK